MKKVFFILFTVLCFNANAYQILSSKELGSGEAKNQNVVVKCTTSTGEISNQTCNLRRYVKCTGSGTSKKCSGWQQWNDLRNPTQKYSSWQKAATGCCRAKGLR